MRVRTRTALALAGVLAAAPLAAQPPVAPAPLTGTRAIGLSADTATAFADTHVQVALSVPTLPNKDELLDLARVRYRLALAQDPTHKGAMLGLARMHAGLGETDRAAAAFRAYFEAYPNDTDARHEAALARAQVKDWPGAAREWETALRLDPDNRVYRKSLGFSLARAGRWDDAFTQLRRTMPDDQARYNLELVREHVAAEAAGRQAAEPVVVTVGGGRAKPRPPVAPPPRAVAPAITHDYTMLIVEVPRTFLTDCGIRTAADQLPVYTLTEREQRMLAAAIRTAPDRLVLTRPRLRVLDDQTGCVQYGQDFPVVQSTAGDKQIIAYRPTGITLRLTPRAAPDGTTRMRAEVQVTTPVLVAGTATGTATSFRTTEVQTMWVQPAGTAALIAVPTAGGPGKEIETLILVVPTAKP